jgi:hypothetical protein
VDTIEMKDKLGNPLAVGDTVATAMVCRHSGNIRVGRIHSFGAGSLRPYAKIKMLDANSSITRGSSELVKVNTPEVPTNG